MVRFRPVAPAVSAGLLVAPQVPPSVEFTTDILTNVSVKFRLVEVTPLPLRTVKVSTLVPPCEIGLGENAFAIVAGEITLSVAVLDGDPAAPVWFVATPLVVLL